jgi:hypothetical protein
MEAAGTDHSLEKLNYKGLVSGDDLLWVGFVLTGNDCAYYGISKEDPGEPKIESRRKKV